MASLVTDAQEGWKCELAWTDPIFPTTMKANIFSFAMGVVLPVLSCSCDVYDYDYQRVNLGRGEVYRGYELAKVEVDGVRLRRQSSEGIASTFYSTSGRPHMRGSHSLGNNQSVRVLSVDPAAQRADLEFGWLDWVGPLTLPP